MPLRRPHKTSAQERLRLLKDAGFELSYRLPSGVVVPSCWSCKARYVDGLPTHEDGCPKRAS